MERHTFGNFILEKKGQTVHRSEVIYKEDKNIQPHRDRQTFFFENFPLE